MSSKITVEHVETKVRKKRMKSPHTDVLFLRGLPNDLKSDFKSYCAKRGKSMKEVLLNFMKSMANKSKLAAEDEG